MAEMHNAITDIKGIRVGHYTDSRNATGCTVVLCEAGAVAGVDVRGAAPGTRETDLLRPMNLVQQVHAVLLSGGSAYGLDAAGGVMRYLESRNAGFHVGPVVVPIVPAAILFDLSIGNSSVRPDANAGYRACRAAKDGPVAEGSVGAGTGATVGKIFGPQYRMKGGLGTASVKIGEAVVGAIIAVNGVGDVVDYRTGRIVAGAYDREKGEFLDTFQRLKSGLPPRPPLPTNTTIGVVATNVSLNKEQANKLAQLAHDGLTLAIRPAHTSHDGDTIFALSTGETGLVDLAVLGVAVMEAVAQATLRAVTEAEGLFGVPAARDIP